MKYENIKMTKYIWFLSGSSKLLEKICQNLICSKIQNFYFLLYTTYFIVKRKRRKQRLQT